MSPPRLDVITFAATRPSLLWRWEQHVGVSRVTQRLLAYLILDSGSYWSLLTHFFPLTAMTKRPKHKYTETYS